jgi:transcriptional regulator with XRE-family HTH domain
MPRRTVTVDPAFPAVLRGWRERAGMSFRDFRTVSRSYIQQIESGQRPPTPEIAKALDRELGACGALAALVTVQEPITRPAPARHVDDPDDEIDAIELARRVAVSDVGAETLTRLEFAFDDLATKYSVTPPALLLPRVRRHLAYVGELLDASTRKTLVEHRRLLVTAAWLSLLAATLHIDLQQRAPADAQLSTARSLAEQAGHREIIAWIFETQAWDALTGGDYHRARDLALTAQQVAPTGSSVLIQATAQEGRAWARLGAEAETRDALCRVEVLVSPLPRPDRPEHHYRYDPAKAASYTATTLAWIGDPAAEGYARDVIARLRGAAEVGGWPRRVAAAQLDLGLALIAADKPDEASSSALAAIESGRIVPSNHWRAAELIRAVESAGVREVSDLREAYAELRRTARAALPSASADA